MGDRTYCYKGVMEQWEKCETGVAKQKVAQRKEGWGRINNNKDILKNSYEILVLRNFHIYLLLMHIVYYYIKQIHNYKSQKLKFKTQGDVDAEIPRTTLELTLEFKDLNI